MIYKRIFKRFRKSLIPCGIGFWKDLIIEAVFDYCFKKGIEIKKNRINLIQHGWQTSNGKKIFAYVWIYPDEENRYLLRIKIKSRFFRSGLQTKTKIVVSKKWEEKNALEQYKKRLIFFEKHS